MRRGLRSDSVGSSRRHLAWTSAAGIAVVTTVLSLSSAPIVGAGPGNSTDCGDTAGPGGTDIPCPCNGFVVTDTKLIPDSSDPAFDPVCGGGCTGNGLIVASNVQLLSLNHCAISGPGNSTGIDISGADGITLSGQGSVSDFTTCISGNPVSGALVRKVNVVSCFLGIDLFGNEDRIHRSTATDTEGGLLASGTNQTISRSRASDSFIGIAMDGSGGLIYKNRATDSFFGIGVTGDGLLISQNTCNDNVEGIVTGLFGPSPTTNSTFSKNTCLRNGDVGIDVVGDGNVLQKNTVRNTAGDGIFLIGDAGRVIGNIVRDNGGVGLNATMSNGTFDDNFARQNGSAGLDLQGSGNRVNANSALANGGEGLFVNGSNNTLGSNLGKQNAGDGVFATGGGNVDDGSNLGSGNGGAQCEIDGTPCQ
jgi:parallel beta-helix repeat protein